MVKYPIGDLIAERVALMGIKPFYTYFEHNDLITKRWPQFIVIEDMVSGRR